jgi:hypothetical protein
MGHCHHYFEVQLKCRSTQKDKKAVVERDIEVITHIVLHFMELLSKSFHLHMSATESSTYH